MKIRTVGTEMFHADRRTDMTKITVTFRSFANALKIGKHTAAHWQHDVIFSLLSFSNAGKYAKISEVSFPVTLVVSVEPHELSQTSPSWIRGSQKLHLVFRRLRRFASS